jgi:hypothetical protein
MRSFLRDLADALGLPHELFAGDVAPLTFDIQNPSRLLRNC